MKKPTTKPRKWGAGYAMVPGWLVKKKPSPNAITVYVHLAMHGTFNTGEAIYESCKPSKRTLANGDEKRGYPGCGLSEQVIGRALRELEALRAIKGEPDFDDKGGQLPNVYRLIFGEIHEEEETPAQEGVSPVTPPEQETREESADEPRGGIGSDTPRGDQIDTGGEVSPVIHNQEPPTQNPLPRSVSVAVSAEEGNPPRSDVDSLPRDAEAENRGEETSLSETEKNLLNAAVEQAIELRSGRPGWSQDEIVEAMQTQLADHSPARVAAAIVEAARDVEGTHRPGRLGYLLTARPISAPPAGTAQAATAVTSVKYLDRGYVPCPRGHVGESATSCNRCAAEAKGADVDAPSVVEGPTMGRAAALALIRSTTRPGTAVRRSARPWMPEEVRQGRSDALARLSEAAERYGDQQVEAAS